MRAFAGGTPVFFSEGGTASHVLAAVTGSGGAHELWAWGTNTYGQLGTGSTTSLATPVKSSWSAETGEQIVMLAAGASHSLMVTQLNGAHRLWAWGLNSTGQIGDGTLTNRTVPTRISMEGSPSIVSVAAGSLHSVAADGDGSVWVWGCDGAQTATSLSCGDLGLYGTRYVVSPTKLTDVSVNRTTTAVSSKSYVNTTNTATLKVSVPAGIAAGDPVSISVGDPVLDTAFQQVATVERSGTTVTLTFATAHGRKVGDKVYARGMSIVHTATTVVQVTAVPSSTSLQFTTVTSGTVAQTAVTTAWIHDAVAKTASTNTLGGSFTAYATQARNATASGSVTLPTSSYSAAQMSLPSTTTAQISFSSAHNVIAGNSVTVSGVGSPWDGTFTVASVSNTVGAYWIRYAVTTQASTLPAATAPEGSAVAFAASSYAATAVSYAQASNLVTVTTAATNTLKAGNTVVVDLDDDRYDKSTATVVSSTSSTFTYYLNSSVATATVSGSVTVIGCFESCPSAPSGVVEVAAGEGYTAARTSSSVITWGTNFTNHYGRLGRTAPTATQTTRFGTITIPSVDGGSTCIPAEITAGPSTAALRCEVSGKADTVVSWGYAYMGRTGAGTANVSSTSLAQTTPAEVTACLSCANNGTTTALGTAATTGTSQATFVTLGHALAAGEDIVQIEQNSAGGYARTDAGRIIAWGSNAGRALGNARYYAASDAGATKEQYSKAARVASRVAPVDSSGSAVGLSAMGADGSCAYVIDTQGVVWSWGYCATSYLSGRGTTGTLTESATLTGTVYGQKFDRIDVPSTARVVAIESMYRYTFMLVNSGDARDEVTIWAMGNYNTEIGTSGAYVNMAPDGTTASYMLPAKIDTPFGFDTSAPARMLSTLSCGEVHCLVTTNDAKVYGWGDVRSTTNTGAVLPSQGSTVYTYGYMVNLTAELTTAMGGAPVNPRVAAGSHFSLIVDVGSSGTGGTVWGWGYNAGRRASTGTSTLTKISPTAVVDATNTASPASMTDVVAVSAGVTHSAAIRSDGSIVTWGSDSNGQLGDGTTTGKYFATPALPSGRIAVQVIAAGNYTMVLLDDGSVVGFGVNKRGVLGNGNTTQQVSPVTVSGGRVFSAIDTSGSTNSDATYSAVGVTSAGAVFAWGANDYGQLGRGGVLSSATYSSVPVAVLADTGAAVAGVDSVVATPYWSGAYGRHEPLQAPGVPTSIGATGGNGSVAVSWTAPSPFRELSGYRITVSGGGATTVAAAGSGETSKQVNGLTNGVLYTVSVQAVNRVGESAPSATATATPSTTPGTPISLDAQPTSSGIISTWTAPSSDGGSAVLDYTMKIFAAGADISTATPVVSRTVAGLTSTATTGDGLAVGTSYDVWVWARNANGLSSTPLSSTAVVPGRPSSPRSVTASGLVGSAAVTWAAPASDGGSAVVSYVVRAYVTGNSTPASTVVVDASTFMTSALVLTDGTEYEVTVAASQAAGPLNQAGAIAASGSESTRSKVVAGRPDAPSPAPTVTPANGALTVTWNPVADVAGITVTHYYLKAVGTTTVTTSALAETSVCTTTCTASVSPLTNGSTYDVSVVAAVGTSAGDTGLYGASSPGIPRTAPGSPQNLSTERADGAMDVMWEPPSSDGGSALTGYVVTVTGGASPVTVEVGATTLAATVTGLVNGTTYTVAVVATNSAGSSAIPASTTQKVFTVPEAPQVTVIGPDSSTLSTTTVESDGTLATLTFSSATNLVEGDVVDVTGLGSTFDGTDLAIASATTSAPYTISYAARDETVVASTSSVGTVRVAGVYLEWSAPPDGGDSVTAYNVSVTDGNSTATYVISSGAVKLSDGTTNATGATTGNCPFVSRSCTITKIESLDSAGTTTNVLFSNGSTYVLSVAAVNAAGVGATVEPSIVVGQPDKPTGIALTASESGFVACWADPSRIPSGRSIQAYRISATASGTTRTKTVTASEVAASSACTLPSVGVAVSAFDDGSVPSRGVTFTVTISATVSSPDSAQYFGAVSAQSLVVPLGVPDAPGSVSVVVNDASAVVTWTPPSNTGGQSITAYTVASVPSGYGCSTQTTTCTVSGLPRGASYVFRVTATNASGVGAHAESQSFTVAATTTTIVPVTPTTSLPPTTTVTPTTVAAKTSPWSVVKVKGSIGGSVLQSTTKGSSATYTIAYRTVTVWIRTGPKSGKVTLALDRKVMKTVDLWARKPGFVAVTVTARSKSKTHELRVAVTGAKNKKSKGATVQLDAYGPTVRCAKGCVRTPTAPKS